MSSHGGAGTRYQAGCRCDECTRAHNDRIRRRQHERFAARVLVDGCLVAPLPADRHGRGTTYRNHGCRCRPCTDAHAADCAYDHQRRKAARA
jgi:hypothetical protein